MSPRQFPKSLRLEVKFSTKTTIVISSRERKSLLSNDIEVVGAIAALFWCGQRDVDGRWFIVDAAESFRAGPAEGGSLDVRALQRLELGQARLTGLRDYVEHTWPPFLRAFHDRALMGHVTLRTELEELKRSRRLQERVTKESILDLEHRDNVRAIVDTLGAKVSGLIFQDLLAYLLALAYDRVQINPVGVPDIEASEFLGNSVSDFVTPTLTREGSG